MPSSGGGVGTQQHYGSHSPVRAYSSSSPTNYNTMRSSTTSTTSTGTTTTAFKRGSTSKKPLPLKQRTSSADPRRDYSTSTWVSLLGLLKFREYFVTVDHFSVWRRHLAWGMASGEDLREHMTKRYASSMVFMSLLLSSNLAVLFNSAGVSTQVRTALQNQEQETISFWIGILQIVSALLTILSLISTFTAWGMVSSISSQNAYCVLRSSIGQYAAELPGRFIVSSIYAFLLWVILFFFLLLPVGAYSVALLCFAIFLFLHTITSFSSFGRVIMHSGAMGKQRIFDPEFEQNLSPHLLHKNLLFKARAFLDHNISIRRQYRTKLDPMRHSFTEEELTMLLSERCLSPGSNLFSVSDTSSTMDAPTPPPPLPHKLSQQKRYVSPETTKGSNQQHQQQQQQTSPSGAARNNGSNVEPEPGTRPRSNSLVKFSDGYDTTGNRVEQQSPQRNAPNRAASPGTPNGKKSSALRNARPGMIQKRVSTSGSQSSLPGSGGKGSSFTKPTPLKTRTNSGNVPLVPVVNKGPSSGTSSPSPKWTRKQPSPPTPEGVPMNHPPQSRQPPPYHHRHPSPINGIPGSPMQQQQQHPHHQLTPSTHEKWLASAAAGAGFAPAGNHLLFLQQQQLNPAVQHQQHHLQGSHLNYGAPQHHAGAGHYGYNQFSPSPHMIQQQQPPQDYAPQVQSAGAPAAVATDSRGISFGSLPSQIGGGERRDSVVSDLDSFAYFRGERLPDDEDDNVADYDDKDIDELLDPPRPPAPPHDSGQSILTLSTKSTNEQTQQSSLLAGLDIEEGENPHHHHHTEPENEEQEISELYVEGETDALLQQSEAGTDQQGRYQSLG